MAQADVLLCKIEKNRNTGGAIPLDSIYEFDRESREAKLIFQTKDGRQTLPGTVVTLNEKRVTMRFQMEGLRSISGQYLTRMVYRATYFFANKSLRVTAKPLGYSNMFKGNGGCASK